MSQSNLIHQGKLSEDNNLQTMITFDNTHFSEKPPKHHSTALNGTGPINLTSETLTLPSTLINSNPNTTNNASNLVDTTNVLRKVLLENLVKNPKTFQGGKDDVMKWLEDLEHLFDVPQFPDTNK